MYFRRSPSSVRREDQQPGDCYVTTYLHTPAPAPVHIPTQKEVVKRVKAQITAHRAAEMLRVASKAR